MIEHVKAREFADGEISRLNGEIARLTRELEAARVRERAMKDALLIAMVFVHESHYGDIMAGLDDAGISLDALATPQEAPHADT